MVRKSIVSLLVLASVAAAQRGDRKGQDQPALPETLKVPAAPVLAPKDALNSIRVQPGFVVELVAAEPLVEDPVCISFDEDGRIWAVEMRGFMPDVDGTGELEPNGRVVVLTDTDGDGKMDESRVFLDQLVLPRMVTIVNQGVLVLEPPKLWLCKDTDGDLVCDEKTLIRDKLPGRSGPEHAINGGMIGLDNWIQFAKFGERLRFGGGKWKWEKTVFRGQWGITQDDFGRHFHNGNSDHLRGDLYPAHYAIRNKNLGAATGANVQIARDQSTWPIRITPGINRGYQKNMLRDYKLARFTAACSPVIYRDDVFPKDCRGNAFVCEPSGNFVRRSKIRETANGIAGTNAYEKDEFLASTDERFRPVDLKIGPDGGLYVVDMYRGILQHKNYVTSFLRKQILERKLDKPVGLGRIYRVMPKGVKRRAGPKLSETSDAQLVDTLSHPGGWWRDTAQRLLIARARTALFGGKEPGEGLTALTKLGDRVERVARTAKNPHARLHALWTLEGMNEENPGIIKHALADPHPEVRGAAARLCEARFPKSAALQKAVWALAADEDPRVVVQAVLSLGEARLWAARLPKILVPVTRAASRFVVGFAAIATERKLHSQLSGAILSGIEGLELEFAKRLVETAGFREAKPGRGELLRDLTRCVVRERKPRRIARLVELACADSTADWQRDQLLRSVADGLAREAKKKQRDRVLAFTRKPVGLEPLRGKNAQAARILKHVTWPGRPGATPIAKRKLTAAEKRRVGKGKVHYLVRCFACHQANGKGQPGVGPSLVGSTWVLGPPRRVIPFLIHGLTGPIEVDGKTWDLVMPAVPDITDEEISLVLSYIRNSWGHEASVVDVKTVSNIRKQHAKRGDKPFTVEELRKIK